MSGRGRTPGPWRTGREDMQSYDGASGEPFTNIYASDQRGGFHLGEQLPFAVARAFGDCGEETKANAAFIVLACNAHDDLLAACEAAQATLKQASRATDGALSVTLNDEATRLGDAIAKARPVTP